LGSRARYVGKVVREELWSYTLSGGGKTDLCSAMMTIITTLNPLLALFRRYSITSSLSNLHHIADASVADYPLRTTSNDN
jgi:hypothetical protein